MVRMPPPDEAFPSLLGGDCQERGAPEEEPAEVGQAVIGDDKQHREYEPDQPLQD